MTGSPLPNRSCRWAQEPHNLYCSDEHPLFHQDPAAITLEEVCKHEYASYSSMEAAERSGHRTRHAPRNGSSRGTREPQRASRSARDAGRSASPAFRDASAARRSTTPAGRSAGCSIVSAQDKHGRAA
jgi:hypothetical protein